MDDKTKQEVKGVDILYGSATVAVTETWSSAFYATLIKLW